MPGIEICTNCGLPVREGLCAECAAEASDIADDLRDEIGQLRAALRQARTALDLSDRAWSGLMAFGSFDQQQQDDWFTLRDQAREAIPTTLETIAEVLPDA